MLKLNFMPSSHCSANEDIAQKEQHPTRVIIRGISGLLGSRLARNIIKYHPDIKVVAGVVRNDPTLKRILTIAEQQNALSEQISKIRFFLDEKQRTVKEINKQQSLIEFEPGDQMPSLREISDVIIDSAKNNSNGYQNGGFTSRYDEFCKKGGKIIIQSGEYPKGRLISPPLIEQDSINSRYNEGLYRQGDCILSGTVPILAAIHEIAERIRMTVIMQYDKTLHDYPTHQTIHAIHVDQQLGETVRNQLQCLFPEIDIDVDPVFQIPGHDYYTVTIELETKQDTTSDELVERLESKPRIYIASENIQSTSDIDRYIREDIEASGENLSPINIYKKFITSNNKNGRRIIKIISTIYSRLAAVLPNIDAIRIIGTGADPLQAMKKTDQNMKLI